MPDLDLQPESPPTSQLDSSNETKDDDISPSEKKKRNKEVGTFSWLLLIRAHERNANDFSISFYYRNCDFIYGEYFVS